MSCAGVDIGRNQKHAGALVLTKGPVEGWLGKQGVQELENGPGGDIT